LKIPYPPLEEQARIVIVLSWFDDLIENKKKQNEILEKMVMAIFKSWFIDFEPSKMKSSFTTRSRAWRYQKGGKLKIG